jgi:23S rRNA pseudouridine1911/1915/1917 synthase
MRLDLYLASKKSLTRSLAKNLIKSHKVQVNNIVIIDADYIVKSHDKVTLAPDNLEIKILYETDDLAIVYKPYNMSVCRTFNTPKYEKVLNEELKKKMLLSGAIKPHEFGLPHRLDKLTEGLMIITKHNDAYDVIVNDFNNQAIKKKYIAIHCDYYKYKPEAFSTFTCEHGYINFSICGNTCICDIENGNEFKLIELGYTETKERVLITNETNKTMKTLIKFHDTYSECILITGVRHQLRATLSHLSKSIIGDPIYGTRNTNKMELYSVFIGMKFVS